jgi:N-acetylglucosaminyldiphosphoundecaprenol N-acetyl-beta-D-mannosaminyltransferase
VRVAMGVGGLFDFYSGRIPRAPVWLRELGFEWVWRLLQEPGRMWRRYVIGNPLFLWRVWRWNAGGSSAHPRHQHSSGSA